MNGPRPRVLLADDNGTNRLAAARMLEKLGCAVDVVVNGLDAVNACRDHDFALVLMDNQMPEMDGLDAAREIRRLEHATGTSPVVIVAVTANAMPGDREACLNAGMNDYVAKPFKTSQLRQLLDRWCGVSPADPECNLATASSLGAAIDSTVLDEFRNVADGNTFVATIIAQYHAESASLLAGVHDTIEHRDPFSLRKVAHALKGASSTIGATGVAWICAGLEGLAQRESLDGAPGMAASLDDELHRVWHALGTEQGTAA